MQAVHRPWGPAKVFGAPCLCLAWDRGQGEAVQVDGRTLGLCAVCCLLPFQPSLYPKSLGVSEGSGLPCLGGGQHSRHALCPSLKKAWSAQLAGKSPRCVWGGQAHLCEEQLWQRLGRQEAEEPPGAASLAWGIFQGGLPLKASCLELVGPPSFSPKCCDSQRDSPPSHGPVPGSGKSSVGEAEVGDTEGKPSRRPGPPRALGQDRSGEACRPSALVPQSPTGTPARPLAAPASSPWGFLQETEGGREEQGRRCRRPCPGCAGLWPDLLSP